MSLSVAEPVAEIARASPYIAASPAMWLMSQVAQGALDLGE